MTPLPRPLVSLTTLLLLLAACTTGVTVPETANGIIDVLEDGDVITCRERREPVPDVVTCEDEDLGDVTVGITDTALVTVAATADSADGPWIAGDTFVVITYDNDVERVRGLRDALGAGEVYTVGEGGEPELVE